MDESVGRLSTSLSVTLLSLCLGLPALAHPSAEAHRDAEHQHGGCEPSRLLRVASALRTEGRYDEALAEVQAARACAADPMDLHVAAGRIYLEADQLGQAEDELTQFLNKAPHHAGVLALRGRTRHRAGRPGAGDDYLLAVAKSAMPEPQLRLDAATALVDESRLEDALDALSKGREEVTTTRRTIEILQDLGRFEASGTALAKQPKSFEFLLLRGRQSERMGDRPTAGHWYQQAILSLDGRRNTPLTNRQRERGWDALHRVSRHPTEMNP